VSAAVLLFSSTKGQTVFLSIFIQWAVMTFSGIQNVICTILTFNKKFTLFYGVFLGGVLFRLILIAVITFIVLKFSELIIYYYLFSAAGFYIIIQILEISFITKTLKGKNQVIGD
jgi:hypothetical protein